jgi:hypothetical protein
LNNHRSGRLWAAAPPGAALLLAVFVAALLISTASQVRADEPPPTNLDLMTRLGSEVAEEIIGKIQGDVRGVRLQIVPNGNGEEYQLLEDIFAEMLEGKGIEAVQVRIGQAPGDSLFAFDYKVPVFRLSYPKVFRAHLIGGKKVKRDANLRVKAKLLSGQGDVLWIGESSAEYSDQFSHGDLDRVQEGAYAFVKPEMPGSGWGNVVEPVFVSAIIVGMIYLFFSNQSDS